MFENFISGIGIVVIFFICVIIVIYIFLFLQMYHFKKLIKWDDPRTKKYILYFLKHKDEIVAYIENK